VRRLLRAQPARDARAGHALTIRMWRASLWTRRRFGAPRDGSAAVEFALVGPLFLALLFAILQLGMSLVLDAVLEGAVQDTSRLIRTGQAQAQGFDKARLQSDFCDRMSVFRGDCLARTAVDVRVLQRFGEAAPDPMTDGFDPDATDYQPGGASELVLVRVWYRRTDPFGLPLSLASVVMGQPLQRTGDGTLLTSTATAFRNEPWT